MGCFQHIASNWCLWIRPKQGKTTPNCSRDLVANDTTQSSCYDSRASSVGNPLLTAIRDYGLLIFPYNVLSQHFNATNTIGVGGFGPVYRARLGPEALVTATTREGRFTTMAGGLDVAIKRLNLEQMGERAQGDGEWEAELHFLGQLRHANLIQLIGFSLHGRERLLVYEFMAQGSLDVHLFKGKGPLSWTDRIKIIEGVAQGVSYLHQHPIIYRDLKAANVLLDDDFTPRLSDFGLARDGPTGVDTHVTTRIMGTYGYAAPEYLETGYLTVQSDVYSFGVLLLEILSGRRAFQIIDDEEVLLAKWARNYLNDIGVFDLVDKKLKADYPMNGAKTIAKLASACLQQEAKQRPSMKDVHKRLHKLLLNNPAV